MTDKQLERLLNDANEHDLHAMQEAIAARLALLNAQGSSNPTPGKRMRTRIALPPQDGPYLSTEEMERIRLRLEEWAVEDASPSRQRSRHRLVLLFLLIRYGALRLSEALAFEGLPDFDSVNHIVQVRGKYKRGALLPQAVSEAIAALLSAPMFYNFQGRITELDPGYVRRKLYAFAKLCGIEKQRLNPRNLRISRALELLLGGVPQRAVETFLGKGDEGDLLPLTDDAAHSMVRNFLNVELKQTSSPRNIFTGTVTRSRSRGILVDVSIRLGKSGTVLATITDRSLKRLALGPGSLVAASVKAPLVTLGITGNAQQSADNMLPGCVASIRIVDELAEVLLNLDCGEQGCAVVGKNDVVGLRLVTGMRAYMLFPAVAVILNIE